MSAHLILVDNAHVAFQPQVAHTRDARAVLRKLLPTDLEWREDGRGGLTCDLETSETARHS
jgi:hypothetical protein